MALAAAVIFVAVPAEPQNTQVRAVKKTFYEERIAARKASGLRLTIYNTGFIHARGDEVSSLKSPYSKARMDCPVFLIYHPRQGYILFDVGISTRMADELNDALGWRRALNYQSGPGSGIVEQLAVDKIRPEDVRWVILSHLHMDHAGLMDAFPSAQVIASRGERRHFKKEKGLRRDYRAISPADYAGRVQLALVDLSTAPPFGSIEHGLDLFSDGSLVLLDLPGYTYGTMGLWAHLDAGPVILAGDAAWLIDNLMDLALPKKEWITDMEQYMRSLHALRALQAAVPRLVIFPGHDLTPRALSGRQDLILKP